jgi:peroxiredoxin
VPVNPLHFGFNVQDQIPPLIQQLIAYQYDDAGNLLRSTVLQPKAISQGAYILEKPVEIPGSKVSFGLRACDYQDGVSNQNGIYSLKCMADGEPSFAFAMDEIPFEDTRYLNAHIDYAQKIYQNRFFHRCFPLEGNKLPIYFRGVDDGMIYLNTEQPRNITISVADYNGNFADINFQVVRNPGLFPPNSTIMPYQLLGSPQQVSMLSQSGIQVVWPEGSFYEKTPLTIALLPEERKGNFSPRYELTPDDIPVHFFFDIAIEGTAVPDSLKEKAYIARMEPDGSIINCGAKWVGYNLVTRARQMGTYAIKVDTIPPKINAVHFAPVMTNWKKMTFSMNDNVRIRELGRTLLYTARVDGQWILLTLDGKTGILTHEFDGHILPGSHELVVKVTDDGGMRLCSKKHLHCRQSKPLPMRQTWTSRWQVGQPAPAFSVILQDGSTLNSAQLLGKKYILFFYNHDDSETCTKEACNIRDDFHSLTEKGYLVFGVSEDSIKKHQRFIAKYNLPYPLISDPDNELAKLFDIYGKKEFMGRISDAVHRSTFVINEKGMLEAVIHPVDSAQHSKQILEAIKKK